MTTAPRSLLFLSCDITGSTAFKQRRSAPWLRTFLSFYREFPQQLGDLLAEADRPLRFDLWKAVGDEMIFTCAVDDERDVDLAVRLWLAAMDGYELNRSALELRDLTAYQYDYFGPSIDTGFRVTECSSVGEVCAACHAADDWPSAIYLPRSTFSSFLETPEDPFAEQVDNEMIGVEETPDDPGRGDLRPEPPLE